MFHLGIFTTHLPYVVLVFFYLVSFLLNNTDDRYTSSQDTTIYWEQISPNKLSPAPQKVTSTHFFLKKKNLQRESLAFFLGDSYDFSDLPDIKVQKQEELTYGFFPGSSIFNRPPPRKG